MRVWPVPASYSQQLPRAGEKGSFWEVRGDKRHTGVDIYAPHGSLVIAVEDGIVLQILEFTSPRILRYYNQTMAVLVKHFDGAILLYAQLGFVRVSPGEIVSAGEVLGSLGEVLNTRCIDRSAPRHIRGLVNAERTSMLHLEMYDRIPEVNLNTVGGNALLKEYPYGLLDPTEYLSSVKFEFAERQVIPA